MSSDLVKVYGRLYEFMVVSICSNYRHTYVTPTSHLRHTSRIGHCAIKKKRNAHLRYANIMSSDLVKVYGRSNEFMVVSICK
jgi:hypothetical protein